MTTHMSRISQRDGVLLCDHPDHPAGTRYTCDAIEDFITLGRDAAWIKPGTVGLPVVPYEHSTMTSVVIEHDPLENTDMHRMKVKHNRDLGGWVVLDLGYWNPGEGRSSIRQVIWNHMMMLLDARDAEKDPTMMYTKCPRPSHGVAQQARLLARIDPASTYKTVCLFNIVFEKMCTECLMDLGNDRSFGIPAEAENWQNA